MNKFLRIISTLIVGIGLVLLFVYLMFQNSMTKAQMLNQPSYYTLQNYWSLLIAGCGCIAFSMIGCFLAWNKKMDKKVEILPNAVAAEKAELLGWLSGSSLDTNKRTSRKTRPTEIQDSLVGQTALKQDNDTVTQSSHKDTQKTGSEAEEGTIATGAESTMLNTDKTESVEAFTVLDSTSPVTVLDMDSTVLTETVGTVLDDDQTVIEKQ